jgi:hypothetical protein
VVNEKGACNGSVRLQLFTLVVVEASTNTWHVAKLKKNAMEGYGTKNLLTSRLQTSYFSSSGEP